MIAYMLSVLYAVFYRLSHTCASDDGIRDCSCQHQLA